MIACRNPGAAPRGRPNNNKKVAHRVSAAPKLPLAFNCDAHYIKKMIKITQITQKVDTQQRVQD